MIQNINMRGGLGKALKTQKMGYIEKKTVA